MVTLPPHGFVLPVVVLNASVSNTWRRIRRRQHIVVMRHANIAMARRGDTAFYSINGPTRTTEVRIAIILDVFVRHHRATISGYGAAAADCKSDQVPKNISFWVLDFGDGLSADVDARKNFRFLADAG